ncbi:ornithine cyclodeaminase family protein [Paracoccus fistulariae]|uniref:NAD(P)-binding domain-containing protein n=1 Tax=Paracoccus fistulariae TaxID=658446 RepID=A0ABY7SH01_9RHOB|nr:NAD(P)-binding domain-containing protein [Paracoccus fistulariae]MDB6180989.1 NAD(P)-binding domain-containing protein [Paracoccus fistulariae]WCR06285.1 NAD(P)-binding domain-containing protein [Paracoccus fistulariae]
MTPLMIGPEAESRLDWLALTDAIEAGHSLPRAEIADSFLYRGDDTLLTRSAWIDGLGLAVKPATIFPGNPGRGMPMVNGSVNLLDDADGRLRAIVDFHLVTKWKTAGDSLLSARKLARKDARRVLIVGAGNVAGSMIEAYRALIPNAEVLIWNRTAASAEKLAAQHGAEVAPDLQQAVQQAEIIATTTMSDQPVVLGEWLSPGTHLDLIGAYRPDLREVDDTAIRRARLFVDSRDTTIGHIGEIQIPLDNGVIRESDIIADFYDLPSGDYARRSDDEITIAKNGGGAHLDLMTARYILDAAG